MRPWDRQRAVGGGSPFRLWFMSPGDTLCTGSGRVPAAWGRRSVASRASWSPGERRELLNFICKMSFTRALLEETKCDVLTANSEWGLSCLLGLRLV